MNLQILWTHIALQSLSEVFEYTYEEFGERQLRKLSSMIQSTTNRLATFPQSGKYEEEIAKETGIEYHSAIVIPEIKLLYTINGDTLIIEFVKNTRMDDATMLAKLNENNRY